MLKQAERHGLETPAAATKSLNVCSRFTMSPTTSRGSWDLSLESNLIFKVTILDERQSARNLSLRRPMKCLGSELSR